MSVAVVIVYAIASRGWASHSDTDLLAMAEHAFAAGSDYRHDAAKARPQFEHAAAGYDELWRRGYQNPFLALNRARSHRLAGDLPRTIVALREGLLVAPWSRPLQVAMEEARATVSYPQVGDLELQCRPRSVVTISSRMSPIEAWSLLGFLWLLSCCGLARYAMTKALRWLLVSIVLFVALCVVGWLWLQDQQQQQKERAFPLVIVNQEVTLRRGNAEAYPPRFEGKLPRGVEAQELTHRGGWVQIRLAGGAVGWIPEFAVLRVLRS